MSILNLNGNALIGYGVINKTHHPHKSVCALKYTESIKNNDILMISQKVAQSKMYYQYKKTSIRFAGVMFWNKER